MEQVGYPLSNKKYRVHGEILAFSYVCGEYFFDHGLAQIMKDLHRLGAEYSVIHSE